MHDFRMELDTENLPFHRFHRGHSRIASGGNLKPRWRLQNAVCVAHPDFLKTVQKSRGRNLRKGPMAILSGIIRLDPSTEILGDELHSVAHAENR